MPIKIWKFNEAPEKLQALSTQAPGREDWIVHIPSGYQYSEDVVVPPWLTELGPEMEEIVLEEGSLIRIYARAA